MINFTVGPVQMNESVRKIGAEQIPYFRTPEFSEIMFENERLINKFSNAEKDSRTVFITGSGTAAMEAVVMNLLDKRRDKVLIVNGGSFGQRFVELCTIHEISFTEIKLEHGGSLTKERLDKYTGEGYTGFLVNIHETSTGVHYDMELISSFCREYGLRLIVDAISSFLADPIDMEKWNIYAMIIGSQKALAVAPGVSAIVMSPEAVKRAMNGSVRSLYFNLRDALKDGERGQTPFTPAVGILIQLNERLKQIDKIGVEAEISKVKVLAEDFRARITDLPFTVFTEALSNAVTPIVAENASAYSIFSILKDEYGIWVCPNGGELKDKVFRVGHIGDLTIQDNETLIKALNDMKKRGLL